MVGERRVTMTVQARETSPPSEHDRELAQQASQLLVGHAARGSTLQVQVLGDNQVGETLTLPAAALSLLREALAELARGHAVALVSVYDELTTQAAADILNVSRPHLVGLLEAGVIPHHKTGTHRRVRTGDVLAYRARLDAGRREALAELAEQAQDLDLGY